MSQSTFQQAEEIFHRALDQSPESRNHYVESACAGNSKLRDLVLALIRESVGAESFFESRMRSVLGKPAGEGARIGPYRLDRLLGSGGMGAVYLADRVDGEFRQQVAIKVVTNRLGSVWEQERLRYERQILAVLRHPNIAALLDGGSTSDGHPYLVMEFVDGQPILDHCREQRLDIAQRLRLMLGVCDAVAFAHRNLVVHRDLKPGNVLVTRDGVPKLLDFGIAKLLGSQETAPSRTAMMVMTPAYASPEQVSGESITTQSDVYSLGVFLYEMLTDRCPFDTAGLSPASVQQLICGTEPPAPSIVGSPRLRGDLDRIVQMAMRKEPERRYAGVDRLAEDIRRYLTGRPLMARQDETGYRIRKFVRRHKGAMTAAGAVVLALIAGLSIAAWYAAQLARQVASAERQYFHFRESARRLLLEFPSELAGAKDVAEVRRRFVRESLVYMDRMAKEAGGDARLAREVARGYQQIGDVQGFAYASSLALPEEAIETYRKGIGLIQPFENDRVTGRTADMLLARMNCGMGQVLELSMKAADPEIRIHYQDCVRYAERTMRARPHYLFLAISAYGRLGDFEWSRGNRTAAAEVYRACTRAVERNRKYLEAKFGFLLAEAARQEGRAMLDAGDRDGAREALQRAVSLAKTGSAPEHRYARLAALMDLADHGLGGSMEEARRLAVELAAPGLLHPDRKALLARAQKNR